MRLGIDPKVDFAFKWLFSRETGKFLLINLLNAILRLVAGEQIVDVEILNPFTEKSAMDDKLSILDIKARDARGRYFNVEMQMVGFPALFQRILYYWGKVYTEQLGAGEDYSRLKPTISICFVDSIMLQGVSAYHTHFKITDNEHGIVLTEDLQIHLFELPKFNKSETEIRTALDRWLYFLRHAQEMDQSHLPDAMDTPAIRQAMESLMTISQTDMEREYYEGRIKARRDANALQAHWAALETNVKALEADVKAKQASVEAQQASVEAQQASVEAQQASVEAQQASVEAQQADWDAKQAERDAMQARLSQAVEEIAQAERKGELVERISTLQHRLEKEITPRTELRAMSMEDLERLVGTLDQQASYP